MKRLARQGICSLWGGARRQPGGLPRPGRALAPGQSWVHSSCSVLLRVLVREGWQG